MTMGLIEDNLKLHALVTNYQNMAIVDKETMSKLKQEIESLKNCANCRHIIWGEDELLCSKNWVGNKMDKCDHWQKL